MPEKVGLVGYAQSGCRFHRVIQADPRLPYQLWCYISTYTDVAVLRSEALEMGLTPCKRCWKEDK